AATSISPAAIRSSVSQSTTNRVTLQTLHTELLQGEEGTEFATPGRLSPRRYRTPTWSPPERGKTGDLPDLNTRASGVPADGRTSSRPAREQRAPPRRGPRPGSAGGPA